MTPENTPHDIPRHIEEQLALYFDNQATDAVCKAIHDWLEEDPANAQTFAEFGTIERMIYCAQKQEDASAIFALLQEAEDNAQAQTVVLDREPIALTDAQWNKQDDPVTLKTALSVLGYAGLQTARRHAVAIASIAALLVVTVTLGVVLINNNQDNTEPSIAEQTVDDAPTPAPSPAASLPIVATLTNERDAVWDRRPGQDLYAGQRFTLTQGFAEITTQRGAVAVLEAPATIELLSGDNALRLHTGKLFGICETQASKGFLVLTPQMEITDLGTRFGVEANGYSTEVHVFEGAVSVVPSSATAEVEPTLVRAGLSAAAAIDARTIVKTELNAQGFDALQAAPIKLRGTGQGLAAGQPDPNWQLMTANGTQLSQPIALPVAFHRAYRQTRDDEGGLQGAWWLQVVPEQQPTEQRQAVIHLIQTEFELATDLAPESTRLAIACAVDDYLEAIHINGNRVTELGTKIGRMHHLTIDQHLVAGRNTVMFEIKNKWNDPKQNPIGLYVRWHLLPDATVDVFER